MWAIWVETMIKRKMGLIFRLLIKKIIVMVDDRT